MGVTSNIHDFTSVRFLCVWGFLMDFNNIKSREYVDKNKKRKREEKIWQKKIMQD